MTERTKKMQSNPLEYIELIEKNWNLPLDELVAALVACQDGIKVEEVTADYISAKRDANAHHRKFDKHSSKGGYQGSHLAPLSRGEADELVRRADATLDRMIRESA